MDFRRITARAQRRRGGVGGGERRKEEAVKQGDGGAVPDSQRPGTQRPDHLNHIVTNNRTLS